MNAAVRPPPAAYPGAAILMTNFRRGDEHGDVRVQDFEDNIPSARFKVCQFIPGTVQDLPGDTPKVWPEVYRYVETYEQALDVFGQYVEAVKAAGWQEVDVA